MKNTTINPNPANNDNQVIYSDYPSKEIFINNKAEFQTPESLKGIRNLSHYYNFIIETILGLDPELLYFYIFYSLFEIENAQIALKKLGYNLESALQTNEGKLVLKDLNISLSRFLAAQDLDDTYETALSEIKQGAKRSHWIWFILPQLKGLGKSERSQYYGIDGRHEAIAYINHPVLGKRLIETAQAIYDSPYKASKIFGNDTVKVYSCIKLFASVSDNPIFEKIMRKEYWH